MSVGRGAIGTSGTAARYSGRDRGFFFNRNQSSSGFERAGRRNAPGERGLVMDSSRGRGRERGIDQSTGGQMEPRGGRERAWSHGPRAVERGQEWSHAPRVIRGGDDTPRVDAPGPSGADRRGRSFGGSAPSVRGDAAGSRGGSYRGDGGGRSRGSGGVSVHRGGSSGRGDARGGSWGGARGGSMRGGDFGGGGGMRGGGGMHGGGGGRGRGFGGGGGRSR